MGSVIGVVLAGGEGRRIGGNKAVVEVGGRPLIDYPLQALRGVCDTVAVVCKVDSVLPPIGAGVAIWHEPDAPRHPLTGLRHALATAAPFAVLVCAVDLYRLDTATLQAIVREAGKVPGAAVVVPRAAGRLQPLCALYRQSSRVVIDAFTEADRVLDVVAALDVHEVRFSSDDRFLNVNTRADADDHYRKIRLIVALAVTAQRSLLVRDGAWMALRGTKVGGRRLVAPPTKELFIAGGPLRGLCAFGVVIYHAALLPLGHIAPGVGQGFGAYGASGHVLGLLDLGVPVFFVLSGYLIGRPYIHSLIFGRPLPTTGRYAWRRFMRIVPVFWAVTAVVLLRNGLAGDSIWNAAAIFGFVQTYDPSAVQLFMGQAWTLDVEVAFYLTVPLAAWALALAARRMSPEQRLSGFLTLMVVVFFGSIFLRGHGPSSSDVWLATPFAMWCAFVPGLALAALEIPLRPWIDEHRDLGRKLGIAAGVAGLVGIVFYARLGPPADTKPELVRLVIGRRAVVEHVSIGLILAGLLIRQWSGAGAPRLMTFRASEWLGERALTLYLVHAAVLIEFLPMIGSRTSVWDAFAINMGLGVPAALAVTAIVYALVERPSVARGHRPLRRAKAIGLPVHPEVVTSVMSGDGRRASEASATR